MASPYKKIAGHLFGVCVSDAVPGNLSGSLFQFHILIEADGDVATLKQIGNAKMEDLRQLENKIKTHMNNFFEFCDCLERDNVRLWYYPKANESFDPQNQFLRIALTISNIESYRGADLSVLREQLETMIWTWIQDQGG